MATGTATRTLSAKWLIGKDVYDVNGDHVGEIADILMEGSSGCSQYAIMKYGGTMGIGERATVVPWQALGLQPDSNQVYVRMQKDRLMNAPGFDRDNPPDVSDQQWARSVYEYWGLQYQGQQGMGMQQQGYQQSMEQQGYGRQGYMGERRMEREGGMGRQQGGSYEEGYQKGWEEAQRRMQQQGSGNRNY